MILTNYFVTLVHITYYSQVRLANNQYTLEKTSFFEYETHFTVMVCSNLIVTIHIICGTMNVSCCQECISSVCSDVLSCSLSDFMFWLYAYVMFIVFFF